MPRYYSMFTLLLCAGDACRGDEPAGERGQDGGAGAERQAGQAARHQAPRQGRGQGGEAGPRQGGGGRRRARGPRDPDGQVQQGEAGALHAHGEPAGEALCRITSDLFRGFQFGIKHVLVSSAIYVRNSVTFIVSLFVELSTKFRESFHNECSGNAFSSYHTKESIKTLVLC